MKKDDDIQINLEKLYMEKEIFAYKFYLIFCFLMMFFISFFLTSLVYYKQEQIEILSNEIQKKCETGDVYNERKTNTLYK